MQYVFNIRKQRVFKNKISYYVRSGLLLHSFTFACFGAVCMIWWDYSLGDPLIIRISLSTIFLGAMISSQLDAFSRHQDYKKMKDLLHENGFRKMLLIPFNKSLCQRSAVLLAAEQFGFEEDFKENYKNLGVKWYHILPYAIMDNPFIFFRKEFLKATFFQPYYQSKYFDW